MYVMDALERCANLAERASRLYRELAARLAHNGDRRQLCHELAFLQDTYVNVLREELAAFRERDEAGPFLPELGERVAAAEERMALLETQSTRIRTLDEATATLVALEETNLEELYDDLVMQGDPDARLVVERLEAALATYSPVRRTRHTRRH